MKIYDGHMHIGGSAAPNPAVLCKRLESIGISGGCVMSIDPDDHAFTYRERIDNLFAWVKGYEDRLYPIAWLHPYEDDILNKVQDCARRGVAGFKFIPNNYYVSDEQPMRVFRAIEELGLPIFFHSGILYDFLESSQYNKPLNWECFLGLHNLRFSLGHCSHPWYDEALSVFGKFRWVAYHTACAAEGKPTIYRDYEWVRAHITDTPEGRRAETPDLYLDTTPGAHKVFRQDLLTKLVSAAPDGRNIFFGTDQYVENYPAEYIAGLLKEEKEVLDAAGASEDFRARMYGENIMKFLGK